MPVHLGSMPMAVASALAQVDVGPGDVVALNDPFAGGTHLPDVTLVMGVFADSGQWAVSSDQTVNARSKKALRSGQQKLHTAHRSLSTAHCLFYVANRAHHADIGGATPGSMGLAKRSLRRGPMHTSCSTNAKRRDGRRSYESDSGQCSQSERKAW